MEPVLQLLGAHGFVQLHEDVAAEAGLVLDAHGRRPLQDVVSLCATDIRQEVVHGLIALDAIEVEADPFGQLFGVGRALAGLSDQLTAQLAFDHAVTLLGVLLDVLEEVVEIGAGLLVRGDLVDEGVGVLHEFARAGVDLVALDDGFVGGEEEDVETHFCGTSKISCSTGMRRAWARAAIVARRGLGERPCSMLYIARTVNPVVCAKSQGRSFICLRSMRTIRPLNLNCRAFTAQHLQLRCSR